MPAYVARRVALLLPVLFSITVLTFGLSHLVPGDPARLVAGLDATQSQVDTLRRHLGLDRPITTQYWLYVKGLVRGDLGKSLVTGRAISSDLATYFPATLELASVALLIALLTGVPIGVIAAIRKNGIVDHLARFISLLGIALPVFFVGIVFLLFFYYRLGWFPPGGEVDPTTMLTEPVPRVTGMLLVDALIAGKWTVFANAAWHLLLPALALSLSTLARVVRMTRTGMVTALEQPYVLAARARGLPEWRVVGVHALKNALIPVLTIVGLSFSFLLGGSVLIEEIFDWPGIGRYAFESVSYLDYDAILGVALVATVAFITINLVVDLLYAKLDPRIRLA